MTKDCRGDHDAKRSSILRLREKLDQLTSGILAEQPPQTREDPAFRQAAGTRR
jgi:hypothetical protein